MKKMLRKVVSVYRHSASRIVEILNGRECWFENLHGPQWGKDAAQRADGMLKHSLGELVEEWIDSGRDLYNPHCQTMLARNTAKIPPRYTRSLFDIISRSWLHIRPEVYLQGNGTWDVIRKLPSPDPRAIESSVHELAVSFFVELLQTSSRYSLSRCENPACRCYFEYERVPKGAIKRGTFCHDCKGQASVLRLQDSRKKRKTLLIMLAADSWPKWKSSFGVKKSMWIAKRMNLKLMDATQISSNGKWVTQNQDLILAEIKRRSNGEC